MVYVLLFQDFMGKSDPYLEFMRQASNGQWQVVHRTEVRNEKLFATDH